MRYPWVLFSRRKEVFEALSSHEFLPMFFLGVFFRLLFVFACSSFSLNFLGGFLVLSYSSSILAGEGKGGMKRMKAFSSFLWEKKGRKKPRRKNGEGAKKKGSRNVRNSKRRERGVSLDQRVCSSFM